MGSNLPQRFYLHKQKKLLINQKRWLIVRQVNHQKIHRWGNRIPKADLMVSIETTRRAPATDMIAA